MSEIKLPITGMGKEQSVIDTTIVNPVDPDEGTPPIDPINKDDGDGVDDTDDSKVSVVEIDGVDYTLDDKGNATKDGQVFKTKEELEALKPVDGENEDGDDDDEDSVDLNNIAKDLNLEFTDEEGNPVTFESTKEGLVNFVEAVYNSGVSSNVKSAREQMIESYPVLEDVINYISVNGSLEGYETSTVDYHSLTLDPKNQNQLISIIRKSREAKGDTEAEINKFVNAIVADNSLPEIAESSLNHLRSIASNEKESIAEKAKQVEEQRINAYREYIGSVSGSIKQGVIKLGDKEIRLPVQFKVPTDEGKVETRTREQFLDYMTTEREFKLKDGKTIRATQFEVDKWLEENRLGYNKDVYEAMRLFTKGDLSSVIDKSVESRRVEDVKKKLRLQSGKSTPTQNKNKGGIVFPVQTRIDRKQ